MSPTVGGVLTGIGRATGRAVVGLTLDVSSGLARAGEGARAALRGQDVGLATLRIRMVILSDEDGHPLTTADAVQPSVDLANDVLTAEAGLRVRLEDLTVVAAPAPAAALNPRANRLLLLDDVLGRTEFYRRYCPPADLTTALVGSPITVVVVREIAGRVTGCSLGVSADWVIVQASLFDKAQLHSYDETVLAHELGHALNLPHLHDRQNLMFPASSPPGEVRGTGLRGWQTAILHANRHVVPGLSQ